MLIHEKLLKRIIEHLARISAHAELLGKVHFFDHHIASEHFFQQFLNQVYGYQLTNANHVRLNAAAIDLCDPQRKLAIQVTTQRNATKIQKTVDNYAKHGLGGTYTTLKVVIIGKRTGSYSTVSVPPGVTFNGKVDVIDNASLVKDIAKQSTSALEAIVEVMEREITYSQHISAVEKMSDEDAILELRNLMDRPALQDLWQWEANFRSFQDAITDLITAINTGHINGALVTKPRFAYSDKTTANRMDSIYTQLRLLRQLFRQHVISGEIDLDANRCQFQTAQAGTAFDAQRNAINAQFNVLLAEFNHPTLPAIG
ncbi:SMEK domain-containing protein [Pseudomonas sp. p99-361]|jgi:hypothetical protein|uniref:SMEK domain-containing protein n=1 Tax=Pseudomonas sp. p99-361 TaxID=2479852 RepID=UPI000F797542|nr:SMEK domain-containing protein [Pseudomonas sp. p99-361]